MRENASWGHEPITLDSAAFTFSAAESPLAYLTTYHERENPAYKAIPSPVGWIHGFMTAVPLELLGFQCQFEHGKTELDHRKTIRT